VQVKTRTCNFADGLFLTPHCRGTSMMAAGCNRKPCDGKVHAIGDIRQAKGNEVCAKFAKNKVKLQLKKGKYFPKSQDILAYGSAIKYYNTKSCLLECKRKPKHKGNVDSIYPNGTPCLDSEHSDYARQLFGIELRCVEGVCMQITNCPYNWAKDACGVCGGDPTRCVIARFNESSDVSSGETLTLATIPAGSTVIDFTFNLKNQKGVRFQVVDTATGEKIFGFGKEGKFEINEYSGNAAVDYAGSQWEFSHVGVVRTEGPITNGVVVKVSRDAKPIQDILTSYLLP